MFLLSWMFMVFHRMGHVWCRFQDTTILALDTARSHISVKVAEDARPWMLENRDRQPDRARKQARRRQPLISGRAFAEASFELAR